MSTAPNPAELLFLDRPLSQDEKDMALVAKDRPALFESPTSISQPGLPGITKEGTAMQFTRTDKGLLDRSARHLEDQADVLANSFQPWGASKETRAKKVEYDRLMRDARDLRMLGKRLIKGHVGSAEEGGA
jgi:hypothetical protein